MRILKKFFKTVAMTLGSLMLLGAAVDGGQKLLEKRRESTPAQS